MAVKNGVYFLLKEKIGRYFKFFNLSPLVCISTSKQVLRMLLADQNNLFQHFNTFFITNGKKRSKGAKKRNNTQKGVYQHFGATFKC